jgi:hypothetical protein
MRAGSIARLDRVEQAAQDIGSPSAHRTYHLPWGRREQLSFDVRDGLATAQRCEAARGAWVSSDECFVHRRDEARSSVGHFFAQPKRRCLARYLDQGYTRDVQLMHAGVEVSGHFASNRTLLKTLVCQML